MYCPDLAVAAVDDDTEEEEEDDFNNLEAGYSDSRLEVNLHFNLLLVYHILFLLILFQLRKSDM